MMTKSCGHSASTHGRIWTRGASTRRGPRACRLDTSREANKEMQRVLLLYRSLVEEPDSFRSNAAHELDGFAVMGETSFRI